MVEVDSPPPMRWWGGRFGRSTVIAGGGWLVRTECVSGREPVSISRLLAGVGSVWLGGPVARCDCDVGPESACECEMMVGPLCEWDFAVG